MSDNAGIMAVSRHLPLLRMPPLLNNLISLILSSPLSFNPIFSGTARSNVNLYLGRRVRSHPVLDKEAMGP